MAVYYPSFAYFCQKGIDLFKGFYSIIRDVLFPCGEGNQLLKLSPIVVKPHTIPPFWECGSLKKQTGVCSNYLARGNNSMLLAGMLLSVSGSG